MRAPVRSGIRHELRDGWRAFTSRRWLWAIVVQFGLVNAIFVGAFNVLGPALAVPLAVALIAAAALLAGAGMEIFAVNWSTAPQEQIPPNLLSRVAAYDALGSFALTPIGTTPAGPIALTIGTTATLVGAAAAVIASAAAVLSVPEVRTLARRTGPARGATPSSS
ncbi:MAG TPA: hypothetical protein VG365_16515 [Solirubrobacteraceae bacterium]|nr:hypothetical protein [Solirubrobacteraceae bacterium]